MKISTKGRYGLRALVDLAAHIQQEPLPLASVAKRQKISLNYLEQVFGQLRKAGILKSMKGPNGGYLLGKNVEEITVKEVLEVLEGPFSICDSEEGEKKDSLRQVIQMLVWDEIDDRVNQFLQEKTLAQLVEEYQIISKDGESDFMYYI